MQRTRFALVATLLAALGALWTSRPAPAQVSARQGPQDPNAFHGSMVLEGPFLPANEKMRLKEWFSSTDYVELAKYNCDRISVFVEFRVTKGPINGNLPVEIKITLTSPDQNHDKLVAVTLEVHNDETVLGSTKESAKVEEGANKTRKVKLSLPLADLRGFNPLTQLRVTMETRDI